MTDTINSPVETMNVTFTNAQHHSIHTVLMSYGLNFEVDANLRVGMRYRHPKKPVEVFVKEIDEGEQVTLECHCEVSGKVMTDKDYSIAEWTWMNKNGGHDPDFIARELHIQLKERPRYCYVFPDQLAIGATA